MGVPQRIALNKEILEFDKSGKTRGKSFKYVSHPSDSPHTMIVNVVYGYYGDAFEPPIVK
jgi:hypothetical protein